MAEVLIAALPLLLLLGALLLGHYPGCDAIVRLSERISGRRPPARGPRLPRVVPGRPVPSPRSGGLLIAFGLAQRPPPARP